MTPAPDTPRSARVIAVASGKGGVGKTNVSVNLAVALARMGRQAMLVDGDVGLANADILLGLDGPGTIADVVVRGRRMAEIVRDGPAGIKLVPGHSGSGLGAALAADDRARLAAAFRPYAGALDDVVVDTASGLADGNVGLAAASDLILLVLSDEPTAFMDAYQLVKLLALEHGRHEVAVIANMVADDAAGRRLFGHFEGVAARFLATRLTYLGAIPRDEHVRAAVLRKRCCVEAFPDSRASAAFARIARAVSRLAVPATAGGNRFFGMEALCGAR